jgi:anti-anti-sigma factor
VPTGPDMRVGDQLIGKHHMPCSAARGVCLFVVSGVERDGCMVAVLHGDLDLASAPALREELLGLLRPAASRLVIDLSRVRRADVSGVAVLVGAGRRARLLGGWLRVASPPPEVARFLSVTGLTGQLAAFPAVADAIAGHHPEARMPDAPTGIAGHVARIHPAAVLRLGRD